MIPLEYYLALSSTAFGIGAYGVLVCRNSIRVLMCLELMMNAANINLVAFSRYLGDAAGQVFVTFSIAIAAAEAAVGLAIILVIYRLYGTVEIGELKNLRW